MNAKQFCFTVATVLMIITSLLGCSTPQKAYLIGTPCDDYQVNATVIDANFTDKIIIGDDEIIAPMDGMYLVVDMEILVKGGKWSALSDIGVHEGVEDEVFFDRKITNQSNGCDILRIDSDEKQTIRLVFVLKNVTQPSDFHILTIYYSDGGCSEPFALTE